MQVSKVILVGVLLYTILTVKVVRADSFYPSGDTLTCKMATTFALGYTGSETENILFNSLQVVGDSRSFLVGKNIHDVADVRVGNLERYRAIGTKVAVPPGYLVDLIFYVYNFSGHSIRAFNPWLYFSDTRSSDIDSIIDVNAKYWSQVYVYGGTLYSKHGISTKISPQVGTIPYTSWTNSPRGKLLTSWEVVQPIKFNNIEYVCNAKGIDASVSIENSGSVLENIVISGTNYSLPPNSIKDIHFYSEEINFETRVKSREVCFGKGSVNGQVHSENYSFLLPRNDYDNWAWAGIQTDIPTLGEGIPYCIKRIDYSIVNAFPLCSEHEPKLIVETSGEKIQVSPGVQFELPVAIKNIGGDMLDSESLDFILPEGFEEYIAIIDDVSIFLESNNMESIDIIFNIPEIILPEQLGSHYINVYVSEEKVGTVEFEVLGVVSAAQIESEFKAECLSESINISGRVYVRIVGNTEYLNVSLPLSILNSLDKIPPYQVELLNAPAFSVVTKDLDIAIVNTVKLLPGEYAIDLKFEISEQEKYVLISFGREKYSFVCSDSLPTYGTKILIPDIKLLTDKESLKQVNFSDKAEGEVLGTHDQRTLKIHSLDLPNTGIVIDAIRFDLVRKILVIVVVLIAFFLFLRIFLKHILQFVRQH